MINAELKTLKMLKGSLTKATCWLLSPFSSTTNQEFRYIRSYQRLKLILDRTTRPFVISLVILLLKGHNSPKMRQPDDKRLLQRQFKRISVGVLANI